MSAIRKIVRFSNSQEILIMKHILRKNYKNSYELYPNNKTFNTLKSLNIK